MAKLKTEPDTYFIEFLDGTEEVVTADWISYEGNGRWAVLCISGKQTPGGLSWSEVARYPDCHIRKITNLSQIKRIEDEREG